jgi:hypothetical protein
VDAYIKYTGGAGETYQPNGSLPINQHNYSRWGKVIPTIESKVDLCKYFGKCDIEKAKFYARQLQNDNKVSIQLVRGAGDTNRKIVEEIEEEKKEKVVVKKNPGKKKIKGNIVG